MESPINENEENKLETTAERILNAAAQLIVENGHKEVSIQDLAEKAMVSRATINNIFGKIEGTSSKAIYRTIVKEFLIGVQKQINSGLSGLPPAATPIERLMSILLSLFASFEFEFKDVFGKVVFQELNLSKEKEESKIVYELFKMVDDLIKLAKEKGEIAEEAMSLDDWKIRQVVFAASRGLLLTFYLKECQPQGTQDLTKEEVIIEVLRIIQLYCSKDAYEKIENNIKAIRELAVPSEN